MTGWRRPLTRAAKAEHLLASYQVNPAVYIRNLPGTALRPDLLQHREHQHRRLFTVNNYPGNKSYAYVDVLDTRRDLQLQRLDSGRSEALEQGPEHQRQLHLVALHRRPDHRQQHRQCGRRVYSRHSPNNRRYDRSNCQSIEIGGTFSSDRRQIFNWTTVYETPKFGNRMTNLLGSGWKILGNLPGDVGAVGYGRPVQRRVADRRRPPTATAAEPDGTTLAVRQPGSDLLDQSGGVCDSGGGHVRQRGPRQHSGSGVLAVRYGALPRCSQSAKDIRCEFRAEAFNLTNSRRAGISPPSLQAGASGLNLTLGTGEQPARLARSARRLVRSIRALCKWR